MIGLAFGGTVRIEAAIPPAFATDLTPASGQGNEKAARNMSSGPPGSKLNYLKTQPAPVLIDCTQRALRANQKCGSIKGTRTRVSESVFLT
jgi:hypothetical protein